MHNYYNSALIVSLSYVGDVFAENRVFLGVTELCGAILRVTLNYFWSIRSLLRSLLLGMLQTAFEWIAGLILLNHF